MKLIIIVAAMGFVCSAFADTKPLAEWSVTSIVSQDLGYDTKYLSQVRYRAVTSYSIRGESPSVLVVEKIIEPIAPGNPYILTWSKKVSNPTLDKINMGSETGYMGNFPNLKWDKSKLSFNVYDPKNKKDLLCIIKDVEAQTLTADCR